MEYVMSETKHSALPWRVETDRTEESVVASDGVIVAECGVSSQAPAHALAIYKANAAFIVKAANCHDELVAALQGVLRVANRQTTEFHAARAAIARATA